ncbi:hypothetical protein SAMN02910327_00140 [Peptostreptococcaceae bacterium pGA-8]|nr:hypothetical protein SAMN02910327_00140 [Peptostreptococcaceae bacterium pGA-8]
MKLILNDEDLELLESIGIKIQSSEEYSHNEIEDILDEVYLNESTNVGFNEQLANKYADLADKIENIIS